MRSAVGANPLSVRLLQTTLVAVAACVGWLSSAPLADHTSPEPRAATTLDAHTNEAAAAARRRVPRAAWRRATAPEHASFQPVVVAFERLPRDEAPPDTVRDPAWAEPMERALDEMLARDLSDVFPSVEVRPVRCVSSSCRVELGVPRDVLGRVVAFAQVVTVMGPRVSPSVDDQGGPIVHLGFKVEFGDLADADEWTAWTDKIRAARRDRNEEIVSAEKGGRTWLHDEP